MPDAVATQEIHDGDRIVVMKFTNISDGTGEGTVKKVDVSALQAHTSTKKVPSTVDILRIWYDCSGMSVAMLWDATANVVAWTASDGSGYLDFRPIGPLVNNAGTGVTGDILFTTYGHTANDSYSIVLEMSKNYT